MKSCIDLNWLFGITIVSAFLFFVFGFILLMGAKLKYKCIGIAVFFMLVFTAIATCTGIKLIGHEYNNGTVIDTGHVISVSDRSITIRSNKSDEYSTVDLEKTVFNKSVNDSMYELRRFGNSVFYIDYYFIKE